jgi:hypothetical protein
VETHNRERHRLSEGSEELPRRGSSPYPKLLVGGKTYWFTAGGSLYRKEEALGAEEGGGFFRIRTAVEDWAPGTENG